MKLKEWKSYCINSLDLKGVNVMWEEKEFKYSILFLVGYAPDIVKKLHNVSGPAGGEAVFSVQAEGKPQPEIFW